MVPLRQDVRVLDSSRFRLSHLGATSFTHGAKHSPSTRTSRLASGGVFGQALKIDIREFHFLQGFSFDNANEKRARIHSAEYMKKIIVQILAQNAFRTLVSKKIRHSLKCIEKSIRS